MFDSPQEKRDLISNTINFVYEFSQELLNDLRIFQDNGLHRTKNQMTVTLIKSLMNCI